LQKLLGCFNLEKQIEGNDDGLSDNYSILKQARDSTQKNKDKSKSNKGSSQKKQVKLSYYFRKN
jgi:hypothetical protein